MVCNKTLYKIRNEKSVMTTITLDKLVADVLQESLPNVHAWIQNAYDIVAENNPNLSRNKKGDMVRRWSVIEAEKSPRYNELLADIF